MAVLGPRAMAGLGPMTEKALARLGTLGLIERGLVSGLRLHRLVAAFSREQCTDAAVRTAVEEALLAWAIKRGSEFALGPLIAMQAHLRYAVDAAATRKDELAYRLCTVLGDHWMRLGGFANAQECYERAVEACRVWGDSTEMVGALNRLGLALKEQGLARQAVAFFGKAMRLDADSVQSLNNMGFVLKDRGKYKDAGRCFATALKTLTRIHGQKHEQVIVCLNNLGLLHKDSGNKEVARKLFIKAVNLSKAVFGPQGAGMVPSLTSMAFWFKDMGRFQSAQTHFEAALKITRDSKGEGHPNNVAPLQNLAFLLLDRAMTEHGSGRARENRFDRAQELAEQALSLVRSAYPDLHPRTADALDSFAELLYRRRRFTLAQQHLEHALEIRLSVLGEGHFDTARNLSQLGRVWLRQVDEIGVHAAVKAIPYLERAIEVFKRMSLAPHQHELQAALDLLEQARRPQPMSAYEIMAMTMQATSG